METNSGASEDVAALIKAAHILLRRRPDYDPAALLARAMDKATSLGDLQSLANAAIDLGDRASARLACSRLAKEPDAQAACEALANRIAALWDVTDLPATTGPHIAPIPGRVAYVLYSSLPHLSTGYAIRSHALAQALAKTGLDVHCITRPGFPWDERGATLNTPPPRRAAQTDTIDAVTYHRISEPEFNNWPNYRAYILQATDTLTTKLRSLRPSLVMAASNHVCALPALRAAHILGLPMVYDMRGMWELSRAAREPDFLNSPQFFYEKSLETAVARQADHVFTLSPPMREAMIARGVDPTRITYLPNGCTPPPQPTMPQSGLSSRLQIASDTSVIGYAGSFPGYEGLEDLLAAATILKGRGRAFKLVLVGDESGTGAHGASKGQLLADQAKKLGIADDLILTGRIDSKAVPEFLEMFDIMVVPRRSLPVTEMVAPLKPAEAMAAGKALIVSGVGGMAGLVEHNKTGLVFTSGDVDALADAMERLILDSALRDRLASHARKTALTQMNWDTIAARMAAVLQTCQS